MSNTRRRALLALAPVAVAATAAATVATAASASQPGARATLAGEQPAWATRGADAGAVPGGTRLTVQVDLALRDAGAAQALAGAVSDPHSAAYGHFLSPAQFDARFAPTPATVARVRSWLSSAGLTPGAVPANRRYVEASGTAAEVARAFATSLHSYRVHGQVLRGAAGPVSVPAGLAGQVLAVSGLSATPASTDHVQAGTTRPLSAGSSAAPRSGSHPTVNTSCSAYWNQKHATLPAAYGQTRFPTYICGYTPRQLESAYGMSGALAHGRTGHGVRIAITDAYASPTIRRDANLYSSYFHIPTLGTGQLRQVLAGHYYDQNLCAAPSWALEESLDVESSHAMAPGADLVYVGARSCQDSDLLAAINKVVAGHLADIVTDSWSDLGESVPASEYRAYHAVFVQAAAEGISVNFSSGDYGDDLAVTGTVSPNFPDTDPMVTAVGGTSLFVGRNGQYLFQTGWGNDRAPVAYDRADHPAGYGIAPPGLFYAGAGGGTSHVVAEPGYQKGVVPNQLAYEYPKPPHRVVPDVSALADPYTGAYFVETVGGQPGLGTIGGTSLASPLFAGMEALASQGRAHPIGFANPLMYSLIHTTALHPVRPLDHPTALAFTSSVSGSLCYDSCLITEDRDSSLTTTSGYDNVTGVGTPNGTAFLSAVHRG